MRNKIQQLQGPILILGASGFIGANLFRHLIQIRNDVYGTSSHANPWRLDRRSQDNIWVGDLLIEEQLKTLLDQTKPRTVFDCIAYGAYSFQNDRDLIYRTNVTFAAALLEELRNRTISVYVHAGSSSEYGDRAAAPTENVQLTPNSDYAVTKAATSGLIHFYGKTRNFPCANLRLYSVYGPYEDASRLCPTVIENGLRGLLPPLVEATVSHDFVYVDDVCEAFLDCALNLKPSHYGESFNIGTGVKTTMADIASLSKAIFNTAAEPTFTMPSRKWDTSEWYADPSKARAILTWSPSTTLQEGLLRMIAWYKALGDPERYHRASKRIHMDPDYSVSAVVACHKDGQAIPIMYRRLKNVFDKLNIDYEIIFVNDDSPDNSEEEIRRLTALDRKVIGISHSRNFGSQAAFRSGMEISTKNACILLDGDLQDPPELIEDFVRKWREGFDVVYGRRTRRVAPLPMQFAYKLFYRIFDLFSYLSIPHDAGDFSLMDKQVVRTLLRFPERDLFIRGIRAYAGFKQTGVDYIRPERMFGVSTNSILKNIGWAKKGIFSFSDTPLNILSALGLLLFLSSIGVTLFVVSAKILFPDVAPRGVTTTLIAIMFFGSINLLAISLLGEYIAKIFAEVKARPHFIRSTIIRDGELRNATEEKH